MTYQRSKFRHHRSAQPSIFNTVGATLWQLLSFPFRKRGSSVDLQRLRASWQEVERRSQGSIEEAKAAVIHADNLVDSVLKVKVVGATMGDRLRQVHGRFDHQTYQNLWEAHKLRNTIAHEANVEPTIGELRIAIGRFRKALEEMGIL